MKIIKNISILAMSFMVGYSIFYIGWLIVGAAYAAQPGP